MNVAIVIQDLRMRGGAERRTSELVKELSAAGHEVHIYANRWDPQSCAGAVFHRVPMLKIHRALKPLSFAWSCSRLLPRGRHDLVHAQARILKCDVVTLGVGCHRAFLDASAIDPERSRDKWFHRAVLHIEQRMFTPGNYRRIITNSDKCKRELAEYYGVPESDVTVVYNGVDREAFSPEMRAGRRTTARTELGLDANEIAILLVGTGFERKGLKTLIRAAGILNTEKPACRIRVLVVGSGKTDEYKAGATELGIAERLVWVGRADDIAKHYAAADIFVLPTTYDPFANCTMEALACGLPVVTTYTNGVSEILKDKEDAFIIEPNDSIALAERLRELVEDSELREQFGSAGRRAIQPYTWQRTAKETLAVYKAVLGGADQP